jgi:hypothetical protein
LVCVSKTENCMPNAKSKLVDVVAMCQPLHGHHIVVDDEEETMMTIDGDGDSRTSFGNSYTSTVNTQNDESTMEDSHIPQRAVERQAFNEWDFRDRASSREDRSGIRIRDTESSSFMTVERKRQTHEERQHQAQQRLLNHARKALDLYGIQRVVLRKVPEQALVPNPKPVPKHPERLALTPRTLASEITQDERMMLVAFSSKLRSDGVQVLKLSRRSKWQVRYLTVSRDPESTKFPKALIWLKEPPTKDVLVLKENNLGRGGLLFSDLRNIETAFAANAALPIPRHFKTVFPNHAGAIVNYSYAGGSRSVLLCFKSNDEAGSFWTAMKIIKEVASREDECDENEVEIISKLV